VAIRLIEDLPFNDDSGTLRIPGGPVVSIAQNQIILWVTVSSQRLPFDANPILPVDVRRFPVLLDTGFNDTLLINERHLRDWQLIEDETLPQVAHDPVTIRRRVAKRGRQSKSGNKPPESVSQITVPYRTAWVWLHRPLARIRDEMSSEPPVRLSLWPGIAVIPSEIDFPTLPLLGLRALRQNHLLVSINAGRGLISIDKP